MAQQEPLREQVYQANLALVRHGLVTLTWGNVSGLDAARGVVLIKPSGVPYETLAPGHIVEVELATGAVLGDAALKPSSDTPTHLHLYRTFAGLGGIVHTHSAQATAWAQAHRPLPCFGTTHADHFYGEIPLSPPPTPAETAAAYEANTGLAITRHFAAAGLDPLHMPAVLLGGHGPFVWGPTPAKAVENAVALEAVAQMALATLALAPQCEPLPQYLLDRHYLRKHGAGAYYGQG